MASETQTYDYVPSPRALLHFVGPSLKVELLIVCFDILTITLLHRHTYWYIQSGSKNWTIFDR